jgi:hypothetical protein
LKRRCSLELQRTEVGQNAGRRRGLVKVGYMRPTHNNRKGPRQTARALIWPRTIRWQSGKCRGAIWREKVVHNWQLGSLKIIELVLHTLLYEIEMECIIPNIRTALLTTYYKLFGSTRYIASCTAIRSFVGLSKYWASRRWMPTRVDKPGHASD